MHMTLEIESEPGRGTRATLVVPGADPGAVQQRSTDPQHEAPGNGEIEGMVLSVEDNAVNQLLVEAARGHSPKVELLQASDGTSGLRLARARQPDIILLNLPLPDMDGYQLMREMADDMQIAAIPAMVLSALSEPGDVERALNHGAVDYLTKPIDLRLFIEKLSAILSQNPPPAHD